MSLWHNLCDASIEPSDAWILLVTFHLSFVSWSTLLEINSWEFKGTPSNATPQENRALVTGLIRGWWWLILPKNQAGYFLGGGIGGPLKFPWWMTNPTYNYTYIKYYEPPSTMRLFLPENFFKWKKWRLGSFPIPIGSPGKATNWRENHRFGSQNRNHKTLWDPQSVIYINIYVHLEPEKKGRVVFKLFLFPVKCWSSLLTFNFYVLWWVTQLHVLQFLLQNPGVPRNGTFAAPKVVRKKTPKKNGKPNETRHHTCGLFAAPSWRRLWFPGVAWRNFQRFRIRICLRVFVAEKHESSTTYFQGTGRFSLVGENRLLLKSTLPTLPTHLAL